MSNPPTLLDADGLASIATGLMMSHHAFRRDLCRFREALEALDSSRIGALRAEWGNFHGALHGHHEAEDTRIFPGLRAQHAALAPTIEQLSADHRRIDPLLDRGDDAFAQLPDPRAARVVIGELCELLAPHLEKEEAEVVPFLRHSAEFSPANEAELQMYADGFAWSAQGIAEDVLETVFATLPAQLRERLPAARRKFAERCERVWGGVATTQSRTPVPDGWRD